MLRTSSTRFCIQSRSLPCVPITTCRAGEWGVGKNATWSGSAAARLFTPRSTTRLVLYPRSPRGGVVCRRRAGARDARELAHALQDHLVLHHQLPRRAHTQRLRGRAAHGRLAATCKLIAQHQEQSAMG